MILQKAATKISKDFRVVFVWLQVSRRCHATILTALISARGVFSTRPAAYTNEDRCLSTPASKGTQAVFIARIMHAAHGHAAAAALLKLTLPSLTVAVDMGS